MWYIAKKKTAGRWTAYDLEEEPQVKRGYEMRGPFRSFIAAMIAANEEPSKFSIAPKVKKRS
jgi:hypothetical protein